MYSSHGANPKITNIPVTSGDQITFTAKENVKKLDITSRNKKDFTVSYVSEGPVKSIDGSSGYFEDFIKNPFLTLYFKVPSATTVDPEVLEVLEWESVD